MDVLSEVLHAVKLEGAVFFNGEFSAPWGFISPAAERVAPYIGKSDQHVIIFHLLIDGVAQAYIEDGPRVDLEAGDIVVFAHGHEHRLKNGSPARLVDNGPLLGEIFESRDVNKMMRVGGGGQVTHFVCGHMACDRDLSSMLLAGLPPIFKVNIRKDASGQWLENSIRFSAQGTGQLPGGNVVLAKLAEVLFVETLRRYMTELPAEETGWLAGARDPEVGAALALLHRDPAYPWTIADLAHKVGVSRSVLADRFRRFLGEPPMSYLGRWRLRLGAQLLQSSSRSVAQIASEVGYESEAAFNRAFKREFGNPPARYRFTLKAAAKAAS
jgi:AraC-like DNA-binding protein